MKNLNDGYVEINEENRVVFRDIHTKQRRPLKRQRQLKRPSKFKKKHKILIIILIIIILYFSYDSILMYVQSLLQKNPTIYKYYLYLENEVSNNTIKGIFTIAVLGSLFFLVLPSEAIFVYYLSSTQYNPINLILIMIIGNLVGLIINYSFGFIIGEGILKLIFRSNFEKYKNKVNNFGGYVLLFGNILPGPIEVLIVFFGGFKYNFKTFLLFSAYGRLIKYTIIVITFLLFGDTILFYYNDFITYFASLKLQ